MKCICHANNEGTINLNVFRTMWRKREREKKNTERKG